MIINAKCGYVNMLRSMNIIKMLNNLKIDQISLDTTNNVDNLWAVKNMKNDDWFITILYI